VSTSMNRTLMAPPRQSQVASDAARGLLSIEECGVEPPTIADWRPDARLYRAYSAARI
jgi:hypothetical protein